MKEFIGGAGIGISLVALVLVVIGFNSLLPWAYFCLGGVLELAAIEMALSSSPS